MLLFVAFTLLAGLFNTAKSEGCCTPDQWEGEQVSLAGYVAHRRPERVWSDVYVYYDATKNQSAAFANYTLNRDHRSYHIVQREEEGKLKLYVVDLKTDKCFQKTLDVPFRKACIPDSAEEVATYHIGAGDASLEAQAYKIKVESEKYELELLVSVTAQGCIPIGETVIGVAKRVPFMESVGFVDIKPGIKDPSVFDVPEQCEEAAPAVIMEMMHHEYSFLAI